MNNSERRLLNARWLAKMAGGDKQFGDAMGMEAPQVSHIIGENPNRGIGNIIARRIEENFGKAPSWLDQDHLGATTTVGVVQLFAEVYEQADPEYREFLEKMIGICKKCQGLES